MSTVLYILYGVCMDKLKHMHAVSRYLEELGSSCFDPHPCIR